MIEKLVSKLFRAYGLYNKHRWIDESEIIKAFQSSFELTGYITIRLEINHRYDLTSFKALSSLRVI